jgi:hypothetical protein
MKVTRGEPKEFKPITIVIESTVECTELIAMLTFAEESFVHTAKDLARDIVMGIRRYL